MLADANEFAIVLFYLRDCLGRVVHAVVGYRLSYSAIITDYGNGRIGNASARHG